MPERKRDPIKRVVLDNGSVRYRFKLDVGVKPDGKRDQRHFTYASHKEAREKRAEMISQRGKGTLVKPNKILVGDYLTEWHGALRNRRDSTLRSYEDALRPVIERYGAIQLQKLQTSHLERLVGDMLSGAARRIGRKGEPLSARSINLMLLVVTMALAKAKGQHLVEVNVALDVERVKDERDAVDREQLAWQAAEAEHFLATVREDRLYAAWLLSLLGLRRGEVLGLRWSDIDLDAGVMRVADGAGSTRVQVAGKVVESKGKTKRAKRTLPLEGTGVADALKSMKARQAKERLALGGGYNPLGLVVVGEDGEPPRPEWYSDRFVALGKAAGLPRMRLHDARHTCGSLLRARGVRIEVAAAWLGHDPVILMKTYSHAFAEDHEATAKTLGAALGTAATDAK